MSESLYDTQFNNTLSMYEIHSPIGRGAGSFVYKVKNRKTKQFAALKVIDKNCQDAEKTKQRTLNEIEIHSQLEHENIVTLHAHFEDKDNYYLLLEACEGGELFNLVKKKERLSESEVRNYGLQLANGLKYLHSHRILHRDLKLSNLLLTEQNVLKICDFGLAVQLTDLQSERDTICGTPNYISPEVIKQESYGTKADAWAFGCILYAMATGNPPFEGSSVRETLTKIQSGNFSLPKDISFTLQDLLKKLICWDSKARIDIDGALNHGFFLETPLSKPRGLPSEKPFNGNNVSISFGDVSAFPLDTEEDAYQEYKFSQSTNCPPSGIAKLQLQQHHRSCSVATSPLLKKPPLGNKKLQASLFSFAVSNTDLENKENGGDSINMNMPSQKKHDYNKNQSILANFSDDIQTSVFPSYQPLQVVDPNFSTYSKKNGVSSSSTSSTISNGEKDNSSQTKRCSLKPLSTQGLKPNKFKTKGGFIELLNNGWICLCLTNNKRKISISGDGLKVKMQKNSGFKVEKTYDLPQLPVKYEKFYTYVSQVCETMRTRVPRIKIEDEEGIFSLSQNKPFPNFEGKFSTGEKVSHTLSSEIMRIQLKDGRVYEINVLEDASYLTEHLGLIVKKSLDKMNLCIQKEETAN